MSCDYGYSIMLVFSLSRELLLLLRVDVVCFVAQVDAQTRMWETTFIWRTRVRRVKLGMTEAEQTESFLPHLHTSGKAGTCSSRRTSHTNFTLNTSPLNIQQWPHEDQISPASTPKNSLQPPVNPPTTLGRESTYPP